MPPAIILIVAGIVMGVLLTFAGILYVNSVETLSKPDKMPTFFAKRSNGRDIFGVGLPYPPIAFDDEKSKLIDNRKDNKCLYRAAPPSPFISANTETAMSATISGVCERLGGGILFNVVYKLTVPSLQPPDTWINLPAEVLSENLSFVGSSNAPIAPFPHR